MSDPCVRLIGTVIDMDEREVTVGVDYDCVSVNAYDACLTSAMADEFAQLFIRACWEAGAQSARMEAEVSQ